MKKVFIKSMLLSGLVSLIALSTHVLGSNLGSFPTETTTRQIQIGIN